MTYLSVKFRLKRNFRNIIDVRQETKGIVVFHHPKKINQYVLCSMFGDRISVKIEQKNDGNYEYTLFFL